MTMSTRLGRRKISETSSSCCHCCLGGSLVRRQPDSRRIRVAFNLCLVTRWDEHVRLSHEQLNELLLSIEESRISRAFYDCLILAETLGDAPEAEISLEDLKRGVTRFRGFAMLAFGNFRFAFLRLAIIDDKRDLLGALLPWSLRLVTSPANPIVLAMPN